MFRQGFSAWRQAGRAASIAFMLSASPRHVHAGDMDLALERLLVPNGAGDCPRSSPTPCADNEAFERLVGQLAVTVAPPVSTGAATLGSVGFYLGASTTLTPVSASDFVWRNGTRGDGSSEHNTTPDAALAWNRVFVRKGLPFGFELGASAGNGVHTSMWALSAELRWALFEGFHSGLGHIPDLALRGALGTTIGARGLALRTDVFDVTLSKPFVVGQSYRVTPLFAVQALFVNAKSGRVDLTPDSDAWAQCAATPGSGPNADPGSVVDCTKDGTDLGSDVVFKPVSHTRARLFLGAELSHDPVLSALTIGYDLSVPDLASSTPLDGASAPPSHMVSFQLSLGLRY